jgi:hypothetical protein
LASIPVPNTKANIPAAAQYAAAGRPPSAYDEVAPTPEMSAAAAALDNLRQATNGRSPSDASAEAAFAPETKLEMPASDGTPAAKPPVAKKAGPISIFVSQKEKKLFVRRGFEPIFQTPIAFDGNQPLGTHLYTATNAPADGLALHWVNVSIASPAMDPEPQARRAADLMATRTRKMPARGSAFSGSTASEALERVQVTPEIRDRIAEMITPGSSLIISDNGLGSETGRGTDFIVLTH